VSIYANINKNNITIKFEIFDHHGNKIFKKSKEDTKENYAKLCDELGEEIINTVGQTKINELDNLKSDFDYTPS
jgi:porphobilinogen deaminase